MPLKSALQALPSESERQDIGKAEAAVHPCGQLGAVQSRVRMAATRMLAVLGEGEAVRRAVGRPPLAGRGVRVLSMDGGGMKVRCALTMKPSSVAAGQGHNELLPQVGRAPERCPAYVRQADPFWH